MRPSRAIASAVGVVGLVATCSESMDTVLEVVSVRSGEDAVDRRRLDATIWYPLAVARISDASAEEVLTGHYGGLSAVRDDGSMRRLWSGDDVNVAAWAPGTDQHPALVFVIDGVGSHMMHALDCNGDQGPCDEVDEFSATRGESALAIADMNEDGLVDILSWGDDVVRIRFGSTEGGRLHWVSRAVFGSTPSWLEYPGPRIDAVDIDDDGHLDVAAVAQSSGARVFFGDGTGRAAMSVALTGGRFEVQVGDLDDDGLPDVLTDEAVFVNLGDRSFQRVELPSLRGSYTAIGHFAPGGVQLLSVDLSGHHAAGTLHSLSPDLAWTTRQITVPTEDDAQTSADPVWVVADLDGDGLDELVAGVDVPPRNGCL